MANKPKKAFLLFPLLICAVTWPLGAETKKETLTDSSSETDLPRGVYLIKNVPYFSAPRARYAPSALSSVISFWGSQTTPQALLKEVDLSVMDDEPAQNCIPGAKKWGLEANSFKGDIENLKAAILSGSPVVVRLNGGGKSTRKGHFALVTGFDEVKKGVYLHVGRRKNKFMPYSNFMKRWEKSDKWALLVTPP